MTQEVKLLNRNISYLKDNVQVFPPLLMHKVQINFDLCLIKDENFKDGRLVSLIQKGSKSQTQVNLLLLSLTCWTFTWFVNVCVFLLHDESVCKRVLRQCYPTHQAVLAGPYWGCPDRLNCTSVKTDFNLCSHIKDSSDVAKHCFVFTIKEITGINGN